MLFDCFFAPKKKKKNIALPLIVGLLTAAAVCPISVKADKKNKKLTVDAIAYKLDKDEKNFTFTFPGTGVIIIKDFIVKAVHAVMNAISTILPLKTVLDEEEVCECADECAECAECEEEATEETENTDNN